jgi:hypothetical protein
VPARTISGGLGMPVDDLLHGFNQVMLMRFDLRQFVEDCLRLALVDLKTR